MSRDSRGERTIDPDHHDPRTLVDLVERFVNELSDDQITKLREHWVRADDVPPEYDGKLLATGRSILGRKLDQVE